MDHPVACDADKNSSKALQDLVEELVLDKRRDEAPGRRTKIQAQPGFPPMPSICAIAAARSPPKEPASAAAEKKMAARMPNSERLYQHDR